MRRIILWGLSTLSALVLLFGYNTSTSGPLAVSATTSVQSGSTARASTGSTGESAGSAGDTGATVTGSVVSTRWGPVQVELSLSAGKIAAVNVLQQPTGNPKDTEINSYALPILQQETLDGQSADIDMVSGATVTSDGYIQSLQSALDQADL